MKVLVPSDTWLDSWLTRPTAGLALHKIVSFVLAKPLWLGLLVASYFRPLWFYAPEKKLRERQYYPPPDKPGASACCCPKKSPGE
jgi:hypothetical protein